MTMSAIQQDLFNQYTTAYKAAFADADDDDALDKQINYWEEFAAGAYCEETALETYWEWQATLPRSLQSDVDPYGN